MLRTAQTRLETERWRALDNKLQLERSSRPSKKTRASTARGGRPPALAIIGEKVKGLRDDLSQQPFARRTKLSIDVIQRAEAGKATEQILRKLCKFAKSNGFSLTAESLTKNTPPKAAKK